LNGFYEIAMTENIPPHPNPLPPRGEGVRSEIFTPLLIHCKKEVILLHLDEKKLKYLKFILISNKKDRFQHPRE